MRTENAPPRTGLRAPTETLRNSRLMDVPSAFAKASLANCVSYCQLINQESPAMNAINRMIPVFVPMPFSPRFIILVNASNNIKDTPSMAIARPNPTPQAYTELTQSVGLSKWAYHAAICGVDAARNTISVPHIKRENHVSKVLSIMDYTPKHSA